MSMIKRITSLKEEMYELFHELKGIESEESLSSNQRNKQNRWLYNHVHYYRQSIQEVYNEVEAFDKELARITGIRRIRNLEPVEKKMVLHAISDIYKEYFSKSRPYPRVTLTPTDISQKIQEYDIDRELKDALNAKKCGLIIRELFFGMEIEFSKGKHKTNYDKGKGVNRIYYFIKDIPTFKEWVLNVQ